MQDDDTPPLGGDRDHLYFIRDASRGAVKIGRAKDPHARLRTLQTGCPAPLKLEHVLAGYGDQERHYHRRFAAHHLSGEWFKWQPVRAFLKGISAAGRPAPELLTSLAHHERRLMSVAMGAWAKGMSVPVDRFQRELSQDGVHPSVVAAFVASLTSALSQRALTKPDDVRAVLNAAFHASADPMEIQSCRPRASA